jgi:hypothetical protein
MTYPASFARMLALLALASHFICAPFVTTAQTTAERFDFYARGPYRENVPRPQSILRFDVGEFHTNYALMERVIEKIAQAAPDRMRMIDIGETNEHRMMHLLAISSPENITRLDQSEHGAPRRPARTRAR